MHANEQVLRKTGHARRTGVAHVPRFTTTVQCVAPMRYCRQTQRDSQTAVSHNRVVPAEGEHDTEASTHDAACDAAHTNATHLTKERTNGTRRHGRER